MGFEQSKAWADRFLDQQFQILNNYVDVLNFNKAKRRGAKVEVAPLYDDQNLETDVIMFGKLRIALRVRRGQSSLYNDIAIRSHRPTGAATELHKICRGFGDYYLYCWTADDVNITEWMIIDLDRFRQNIDYCLNTYDHYMDDGSAFNTYSIDRLLECGACVSSFLNVLT